MGVGGRAGMFLEMGSLTLLSVVFIVVPLQVDVKKTALALAITDSELSDEEASILESGGFSVSRATTPQLTDVSEGMGSPLSLLIFLFPIMGCWLCSLVIAPINVFFGELNSIWQHHDLKYSWPFYIGGGG